MSDFSGMEDLLQDFLQEASDLLSDVDNKLVDLEKMPDDRGLLNDIFRGFHTVKGGAGFLNATELVTLCHLTENLFDRLRNGELELTPELMDVIMAATKGVREMFGELGQMVQPQPADAEVIAALQGALSGEQPVVAPVAAAPAPAPAAQEAAPAPSPAADEPDWSLLHAAVAGQPVAAAPAGSGFAVRAPGDGSSGSVAGQCPACGRARPREHHPRRYLASRPGAQPVRRNRPDQEPADQLARRHPGRQERFRNPACP